MEITVTASVTFSGREELTQLVEIVELARRMISLQLANQSQSTLTPAELGIRKERLLALVNKLYAELKVLD